MGRFKFAVMASVALTTATTSTSALADRIDDSAPAGVYQFSCAHITYEQMRYKAAWVSEQQVKEMAQCVRTHRPTNSLTGNEVYNRRLADAELCRTIQTDPEPVTDQIKWAKAHSCALK